jgi:predicted RNA-binding protein YlxR (DUF448 family)
VPAPLDFGLQPKFIPSDDASRRRGARDERDPERTCILSRAAYPRDSLIRLALSPDGELLPDVRAKAPGRGAWLGVDRSTLEDAQAKGRLRGALARAFKGAPVRVPDDLGERIETALRQAALDRLGLEARAGTLLTGSEKIDVACRKGEVQLLLHARDASEDGNRKLDQALRVGGRAEGGPSAKSTQSGAAGGVEGLGTGEGQGLVIPAERAILSLALGRQNVVHIALIDRGAAARVRHALDRWRAFIGPDFGLGAASAAVADASPDVGRAVDGNEG